LLPPPPPPPLLLLLLLPQAGGCYVPLDPGFPADRLSIYLEDSESLALMTEPAQAQLAMNLVAGLPLSPQVGSHVCVLEGCYVCLRNAAVGAEAQLAMSLVAGLPQSPQMRE
jgi:non-ribosomal peptide synthetase component F